MFGIIEYSSYTGITRENAAGLSFVRLSMCDMHGVGGWIRQLKKAGVTRTAVSEKLYGSISGRLVRCGVQPISGALIARRIVPQMVRFAAEILGLDGMRLGVEISPCGQDVSDSVENIARCVRYVSVRGEKCSVSPHSGISIMQSIPRDMCDALLSVDLGEGACFLKVFCRDGVYSLKKSEILLPHEYRGVCGEDCKSAFVEALIQYGRLRPQDVSVSGAVFEYCRNMS